MHASGFAELTDVHAPAPERAPRSPGLLAFGPGLFARRFGRRIEQGVMLMAAPLTCQAASRADDAREAAREARLPWGLGS